MRRDPLRAMLRMRQATLDEAQKAVAEAYRLELEASTRAEAAAAALEREMQAASCIDGSDDTVETFARWLPIGRRMLQAAHEARLHATAELDRARAVLALARAGARAVEALIEQRTAERKADDNRKEQLVLDEAGSARRDR